MFAFFFVVSYLLRTPTHQGAYFQVNISIINQWSVWILLHYEADYSLEWIVTNGLKWIPNHNTFHVTYVSMMKS